MLGGVVGGDAGGRPPTPAMKRFADSVARQKGIKPPAGYTKSGSICRAFLDQHAPQESRWRTAGVNWFQTGKSGADVVRREDCAGEGDRHSRRDQDQLGCRVCMDYIKPEHGARQGSSQDRPQTGETNGVQIAGADEEITDTQS